MITIHQLLAGFAIHSCIILSLVPLFSACYLIAPSVEELTIQDLEAESANDIIVTTVDGRRFHFDRGQYRIARDNDSLVVLRGIATDQSPSSTDVSKRISINLSATQIDMIESRQSSFIIPLIILGFLIWFARFGATFSL